MSSRQRSNPLALAVLALLYERPMHPYEMATTLRERRKEDSIKLNYGSLYSVVQSLERRGLIVAKEVQRDGTRPERTVYAIAESGAVELLDWLSELVAVPGKEFTQFEAALSLLPCLRPEEAVRLLEERVSRLEEELAAADGLREHAFKRKLPRLLWIEGEYRIALRRTELEYVSALVREIREETIEGMELWREFQKQ
ncbi:PadR family transcriptional regulator [Acrocarpospora phusangensis]|uniref:PadR family transcriptional regulator n=1 Tax=Acrocarpospora phusangensis TaxID=1070424 RepID=A0A919UU14_9ACTN|nr:PadR family transcriptional regulator [Acrocarpospora phusangensis]GIH27980.1 PadR family transcriptional regulator [Acrocarpospora phusangensis]